MSKNKSESESYKQSGVDITEGYRAVELMKKHVSRTFIPGVEDDLGGFGGLFSLNLNGISDPVLVSGTDGVGTKLKLAFLLDKHDTVGIDCVAMCVNDIICCGARPLFFLDYIALGKNRAEKVAEVVGGVAEGCVQAGCALIGGETAEMPGFYPQEEYDLAGFSVGIVDRSKVLNKNNVRENDVILALPSSGLHSNGFSLVRKVLDVEKVHLGEPVLSLGGKSLGEVLLTPTRIYVKPMLALMEKVQIKSVAHITGGGFYENIPRSLPSGLQARIQKNAVKVLPIFDLIRKVGSIPEKDMFNTFNMGVGMTVIVSPEEAEMAQMILREQGQDAYVIGEVAKGESEVILC
ncbi:MAG: phosphoribosylformylglycinamidine cyclo-ligase [Clostridia bacterium]|nr:phosphoribosylformylglycinamidine cyclo-ligase [Clostridia bacterium]